jgi:cytochrome c oxidase cbb3-type subunit 3
MKKVLSFATVALVTALFVVAQTTATVTSMAAGDPKAIYAAKCAKCHGADGKGVKSLEPPDFTDAKWQSTRKDSDFAAAIKNGKEQMPATKLPPADVTALVKYVRSFAPGATPPKAAPAKGKKG